MYRGKGVLILSAFLLSLSLLPVSSARAADIVYRVKPGENLNQIAKLNNIDLNKLLSANPFVEYPYTLYPGQIVVIPDTKQGEEYTVKPGDTLISIADAYGIDIDALISYNNLKEEKITPGQVLTLPPITETKKKKETQQSGSDYKKPVYEYNIPELLAAFPSHFYLSGKPDKKVVALTFDDGPDKVYSPQIFDILKKKM